MRIRVKTFGNLNDDDGTQIRKSKMSVENNKKIWILESSYTLAIIGFGIYIGVSEFFNNHSKCSLII